MSKSLWAHQEQALKVAEVTPDLGLFFEQGTGKTRTMIEIIRRRYAKVGKIEKTLVLAPVIVCDNWKKEFAMFSKIPQSAIVVLQKSGKKRIETFLKEVGPELLGEKIIITNYEAMEMQDLYKLFMAWGPKNLICDESQRLKNPQSVRAKAVVSLADNTQANFILTGTPILNSAMDSFMQFRVLDRGATFGKNFFAFRNQYFLDENAAFKGKQSYFPKWAPRPESYDQLQEKIKRKALRVLKKDCLDLPPFIRQEAVVELSAPQAKAYKEMMNEYITFIESQQGPAAVIAQLAVTKALRLQQIVSGFVKDDLGNIHRLPCPRLDALSTLLEDIAPNNKVIVWASFKENYKMIAELCTKLGLGYTEIHGDISKAAVQNNMDIFRTAPGVRVMIANQKAGGVGINLVESNYSIYYSKNFSLEDDLQSEARNYRGGSEVHDKVTRIDLVAKGTIDELVNESLALKQSIGDKILGWKDKLWS